MKVNMRLALIIASGMYIETTFFEVKRRIECSKEAIKLLPRSAEIESKI
jgi:hypothetical protein